MAALTLAPLRMNFGTGADKRRSGAVRWSFMHAPVEGGKGCGEKKMGDGGTRRFLKHHSAMEQQGGGLVRAGRVLGAGVGGGVRAAGNDWAWQRHAGRAACEQGRRGVVREGGGDFGLLGRLLWARPSEQCGF
jgi:hypothetical protein